MKGLEALFLEEAHELFQDLEAALLALEKTPEDRELINRIFRALHTIKGAGGMFGFAELTHFVHRQEDCFDRITLGAEVVKLLVHAPQLVC